MHYCSCHIQSYIHIHSFSLSLGPPLRNTHLSVQKAHSCWGLSHGAYDASDMCDIAVMKIMLILRTPPAALPVNDTDGLTMASTSPRENDHANLLNASSQAQVPLLK